MSYKRNPIFNSEGYIDKTAFDAINHVTQQEQEDDKRAHRLIKYLRCMIEVNGYKLISMIEITDNTEREYR